MIQVRVSTNKVLSPDPTCAKTLQKVSTDRYSAMRNIILSLQGKGGGGGGGGACPIERMAMAQHMHKPAWSGLTAVQCAQPCVFKLWGPDV